MLITPVHGLQRLESNVGGTAATEFGAVVTNAATAHVKGSWVELIASTSYPSYGISILMTNIGTAANTNARMLVDIGIGASGSEQVLIANLLNGNISQMGAASGGGIQYFFPIMIPAGSRLSARSQGSIVSSTGRVAVWLYQWPLGIGWVGSRVTTYGIDTATSTGVSVPQGTTGYGTTTQIVASCANPIKYMQLGMDMAADTTGNNKRGIVRIGIGSTPEWIVSDLPFSESTTLEEIKVIPTNFILSHMRFNIPAGTRLALAARVSASAENRGWAIYAVD